MGQGVARGEGKTMSTTHEGRNGGPQISRRTAPAIDKLEWREAEPTKALLALGEAASDMLRGGRRGWSATVTDQGSTLHLSLLVGEDFWVVDGLVPAGTSMPRWMNGWGSRCTRLYHATAPVQAALDAAVAGRRQTGQCAEHGGRDLAACDHGPAESPARAAIRAMLAKRYRGAIEPTEAMIDAVEAGLAGQS